MPVRDAGRAPGDIAWQHHFNLSALDLMKPDTVSRDQDLPGFMHVHRLNAARGNTT